MIRKITVINQRALSWEHNEFKPVNIFAAAAKQMRTEEDFFRKAALLISMLGNFPEQSIEKMIVAHFGPNSYSMTKKTRKSRSWFVHGGLYIHEED